MKGSICICGGMGIGLSLALTTAMATEQITLVIAEEEEDPLEMLIENLQVLEPLHLPLRKGGGKRKQPKEWD